MNKVRNIQQSMSCLALSLGGLVPVLGFPLAILAAFRFWKAVGQCRGWNPARTHLVLGGCLGGLGVILSVVEVTAVAKYWIDNYYKP